MKLDIMVKVTGKGIEVPPNHKPYYREILKYCIDKKGGYARLQLSPVVQKRTTGEKSQSHHFNGHVKSIADALQRKPEQVKKYMKYLAIENGFPVLKDQDDIPVFDLWDNVQGISETDSSIVECAILIETCHIYAAKNGIELNEGGTNDSKQK